jgi:predicted RND superfamily exporter protein
MLVGLELRGLFRKDAVKAVGLGLAIVALLLYLDFRRLSLTLFAMLQLGAGVIAMLGCMRLLGIQMNFVNAFATTMILGVGVDYGIHIIHRLARAERPGDEGVLETGKAVVMAALTNIAGFGTVAFSNYPGLRSVGLVCVLGTVGCLFTSLTLLPALMVLLDRRRQGSAGAEAG